MENLEMVREETAGSVDLDNLETILVADEDILEGTEVTKENTKEVPADHQADVTLN